MDDATYPLIDLHRHLDGNVRLTTILDLGRRHNLPLPAWDLEGLRPHVQVTAAPKGGHTLPDVMAFVAKFKWMTEILVDYDACRRVAYENVEDALHEGLRYVELRFSPQFMAESHGLHPEGVVEAVADGIEAGTRDFGIKARLIGIISRTYGVEAAWQELGALLRHRDHLVALDLAGDEANWPGELFVEHFRRARDVGWEITVHAGEAAGSDSVWQAIRDLGATRIGHALAAVEDPSLLEAMAERRIGVESCLTSNVQTATVPDYASHPIRRFLERGLLATLNTDDPGISAVDLPYELEVAAPAAGLTPVQIRQAQRNALAIAFLSPEEASSLLRDAQPSSRERNDRGSQDGSHAAPPLEE
jgi:adenosine deaminase